MNSGKIFKSKFVCEYIQVKLKKNFSTAQKIFKECVTISNGLGDKKVILHCLERLANVFFELGKNERACRLFALIKSLNESLGTTLAKDDLNRFGQTITVLKSKLGKTKFEDEWSKGTNLTLEEAVQFAMEGTDE